MRKLLWFILGIFLVQCKVSTTSKDWTIRWDESSLAAKSTVLANIHQSKNSQRPNVILIMADDLGKYEVSAYGAQHISTPNIDQLSKEGVLFEEAYVTAPICSPSRAAILTGKYPQRYGFETQPMEFYPSNFIEYIGGKKNKNLGDWKLVAPPHFPNEWELQKQGVPLDEINLAEVLSAVGYQTAIIGKWHLGYGKEQIPNNRGFDYQYGFYGAFSLYTPRQKTPGYVTYVKDDLASQYQWNMERKETAMIRENNKKVIEDDYLTFAIKDKAVEYIKNHKDSSFFLYVPFSAPHVPFQAPKEYYDQFAHVKDSTQRVYLAMIKALDDAIGEINQAVKNEGIEENTIIYFISDNGGASYTGATDNGPLKGGKLTHFEGGVNVPFIMKWKGHIPTGISYNHNVSGLDIFATTIANCKVPWPTSYSLDGEDLVPYIMGERTGQPHETLFWRTDHIHAIQSKKWKLILSSRDKWVHLYDLASDKSEKIDLKDTQIEKVQDLMDLFEAWNNKLPSKPLWPRIMDRKFEIDGEAYYFPA
jgi:arylsulfatase A-like enzyme